MKSSERCLSLLSAVIMMAARSALASSSSDICIPEYYADGDCDDSNNSAECGYDSGDCCSCTCEDTRDYTCGGNGFACIDPAAACVNDDDITELVVINCGYLDGIGNGYCDQSNNNAICGYDGGDCCECTCGTSQNDDYYSNSGGCSGDFLCIDPAAACVDDDDITVLQVENCEYAYGIGDGYCDQGNNNELCGFDGGDCCECTCVRQENQYDDDYNNGCTGNFLCIDPAAACVNDDDITVLQVENCGYPNGIANGYCDQENNNEICGFDGGDCCECTCVRQENPYDDDYNSGCTGGFMCIDPAAACVNDDDITVLQVENCDYAYGIGNGYCDQENNNEICGYDGGDCCECTCVRQENQYDDDYNSGCTGYFLCIDPAAACVNDDDITVLQVENCNYAHGIGNGYCDEDNNNADCGYDGGDCCECTCVPPDITWTNNDFSSETSACGGAFACIDPEASCVNDDDVTIGLLETCDTVSMSDAYCNDYNNKPECNYDGGDCCPCTCEDTANATCGRYGGFACIDPEAICVDDDDITVDMLEVCGYVGGIGNGYCNIENNKEACNYDGGDCCECTCDPTNADDDQGCDRSFACIDPMAPCVDDDDITLQKIEGCDYVLGIGDGYCDQGNNNDFCGYDGGDCCSCTCQNEGDDDYLCSADGSGFNCEDPSAPCFGEEPTRGRSDDYFTFSDENDDGAMSFEFIPWEQDEPLPTVDGAVEVGTKTEVNASATAFDARPGMSSNSVGCGQAGGGGCAPANTRDGISSEIESRWSCASRIVEGEGPCQIEYKFAEPQDIVDIQVVFWKGDERTRKLQIYLNGEATQVYESSGGPGFDTLGVGATGVSTVTLESVELLPNEWISLIEVLIFVTP